MKMSRWLCIASVVAMVLPMLANAEIYKWRDKNGVMRYSDTPPPAGVKQETMGYRRSAAPTGNAPLAPSTETAKVAPASAVKNATGSDAGGSAKKNAEGDKKANEEKEKYAKIKEENCKTAKANFAGYQQGGRLFKVDEKGQRHYIDDAEMKAGAEKAQRDIDENCN